MVAPVGFSSLFFFNDTATTEIYTLSLHDALPISANWRLDRGRGSHWCTSDRGHDLDPAWRSGERARHNAVAIEPARRLPTASVAARRTIPAWERPFLRLRREHGGFGERGDRRPRTIF